MKKYCIAAPLFFFLGLCMAFAETNVNERVLLDDSINSESFEVSGVLLNYLSLVSIQGGQQAGDYGETKAGTRASIRLSEKLEGKYAAAYRMACLRKDANDAYPIPFGKTEKGRGIDSQIEAFDRGRQEWHANAERLKGKMRDF